jgi:hypothetical protein
MGLRGSRLKNIVDTAEYLEPKVSTGTADIDISAAVYTGFITLLTITPATGETLQDLQIDLAYNKATTGVSAVATNSDTLDVQVIAKADDTNHSRIAAGSQVTLTGSATPIITGERFKLGAVDGVVEVQVKLSAERADAEIPYKVTYRSLEEATITAVAAG